LKRGIGSGSSEWRAGIGQKCGKVRPSFFVYGDMFQPRKESKLCYWCRSDRLQIFCGSYREAPGRWLAERSQIHPCFGYFDSRFRTEAVGADAGAACHSRIRIQGTGSGHVSRIPYEVEFCTWLPRKDLDGQRARLPSHATISKILSGRTHEISMATGGTCDKRATISH
jgi:hypothetical protein